MYAILAVIVLGLLSLLLVQVVYLLAGKYASVLPTLSAFAAGTLLASSLLTLVPEASHDLSTYTVSWLLLVGITCFYLLERSFLWHHCHVHEHDHQVAKQHSSTKLVTISDFLHNFVDGIAIVAAFMTSPWVGLITTVAIMLHEIPQEIADISVMFRNKVPKAKAFLLNGVAALGALVGVGFGMFLLSQHPELPAYTLAVTAGMFLYISLADIIPGLHGEQKSIVWQVAAFVLGIACIASITQLLPHEHHHVEQATHQEEHLNEHEHEEEHDDHMDVEVDASQNSEEHESDLGPAVHAEEEHDHVH